MDRILSWIPYSRKRFYYQQKLQKQRFGSEISLYLPERTIKVLVLGAQGVGKTSLIRCLLGKSINNGIQSTVYDVYEKEYNEDYGLVRLELTDMTGQFAFPAMERVAIQKSDVFVLVYSLDNSKSMKELDRLRKVIVETKQKHSTEIPIIVVGNKMDLVDSSVDLDCSSRNSITDWCFSHIQTSVPYEINLYSLELALIQECTTHAIVAREAVSRQHSGRILYLKSKGDKNLRRVKTI